MDAICHPDVDWGCESEEWVDALDPTVKERSEAFAWLSLQSLSGYRLAICPVTVRPCSAGCIDLARTWQVAPVWGGGTFTPTINSSGMWVNSCGCRPNDCSCTAIPQARLIGPVGGIVSVLLNGAVLDPSAYRVDNGVWLVRTDGEPWPSCQDMVADPNTPDSNTFAVTYYMGFAPDPISSYAAGLLAVEYAKNCMGDTCRLPANITGITRQGVAMDVQAGLWPNGFTGIEEVDAWIFQVNPHNLKQPTTIASPDYRPGRMTTVQ